MAEIGNIRVKIKKYKYVYAAVFFIFVVGIFLRVYNFSPWMHFELDQARDVFIIKNALENGIENLPLLGPQARGKELYLGPIFYYFSYISSFLLGVSPESMALPDLFFSILSIPLFYFFARIFFSRWTSVALVTVVATSLFLVTYARFAWNPNGMFFWSLVAFYGLLQSYRDEKFKSKWFLVFVFGIGILTQLHFIAFIAAPLTSLAYVLLAKIRIPWRTLVGSVGILLFIYSSVIFSEFQSQGKNTQAFFLSIVSGNNIETNDNLKDIPNRGIIEKILRASQESSTFYWNIISSDNVGRYNIRIKKDNQAYLRIVCNENCKKALPHHLLALFVFGISLGVFGHTLVNLFYRRKKIKNLEIKNKYHAYLLIGLWLFFGGGFLVLVAYQISPRFFLYLAAPFLILLGVILEKIKNINKVGRYVFVVMVSILVGMNLYVTKEYFGVLKKAKNTKTSIVWHDIAMNQNDIVTLGQLREAGLFLKTTHNNSEKFVVIGDNPYARAFYYIVAAENNNKDALCYIKTADFDVTQLAGMTYYVLLRNKSRTQISQDMLHTHYIQAESNLGTINLYKIVPNVSGEARQNILNQCYTQ